MSSDHDHSAAPGGHGHSAAPGGHGHSAGAHDYRLPDLPEAVDIFDTTLRDGSQQEGLSLTVDDKLRVAEQLDHLGVAYIEGGWPGANPKDDEFFRRAPTDLRLTTSTLVAFGSTRRAGVRAEDDTVLQKLVDARTPVVCIVAKSWDRHVTDALRTSLDEAVAMVADSVAFLRDHGTRVFLDAEHFFDGYRSNPDFALRVLAAAEAAGAESLVLCDTNGGSLPDDVGVAVADVRDHTSAQLGIHCHNDAGCAVANSLVAVQAGATQVQGCVNGYGERAGNADLSAAIPDLSLKLNIRTIPPDRLERLTPVARHIAELVNVAPSPQQPYVGVSVFAHKGGLHASAVARRRDLYEHVSPDLVGNGARVVVSEMAGRSTLVMKAAELGLELDGEVIGRVLDELKRLEHEGYHFEVADGSLELLLRRAGGWEPAYFEVESFRVITDHANSSGAANHTAGVGQGPHATEEPGLGRPGGLSSRATTEATVKVHVGKSRMVATAEGNGPVNALDAALRQAIGPHFPALAGVHLTDYRVRVLDTGRGTGAVTRVLVDTTDGERTWTTIGVSENIIEASWQALYDSIVFALLHVSTPGGPDGRGGVGAPGGPSSRVVSTMTQPSFVPIAEADQVRSARRLHVPGAWSPQRPAEIRIPVRPSGPGMGTPGPDQGFALHLARRFADRLQMAEGESAEDAMVGGALLASRRAGIFGRAPSVHDLTVAFSLWGFLGHAPADLVAARRRAFLSASHDYDVQRRLVDRVPEEALRLTPAEVSARLAAGEWRALLGAPEGERAA